MIIIKFLFVKLWEWRLLPFFSNSQTLRKTDRKRKSKKSWWGTLLNLRIIRVINLFLYMAQASFNNNNYYWLSLKVKVTLLFSDIFLLLLLQSKRLSSQSWNAKMKKKKVCTVCVHLLPQLQVELLLVKK